MASAKLPAASYQTICRLLPNDMPSPTKLTAGFYLTNVSSMNLK